MYDDLKDIYNEIVNDPDLFEELVNGYLDEHPNSSHEEMNAYIVKIAADELSQEADSDKKKRQTDMARDRVISKALNNLPGSGDTKVTKTDIKTASLKVSNSSIGHDKEMLADMLRDCSTSHSSKIKKRRDASDSIRQGI